MFLLSCYRLVYFRNEVDLVKAVWHISLCCFSLRPNQQGHLLLVHTQQAVEGEGDGEALIHDIQPITPTVSSVPIGGAHPKVPRQTRQGKHSSSSSSALTSSDSARSFKM